MSAEDCVFCFRESEQWRTIYEDELCVSFVSYPWFRYGHCLVIPRRHITVIAELFADESVAIMSELGRLSTGLDKGYGSGVMQKYQPLQAENGIKVHHLHFHVFPRVAEEAGLFPTPEPNDFSGFTKPTRHEASALVRELQP